MRLLQIFLINILIIIISLGCSNDMNSDERMKNNSKLSDIEKILLFNTVFDTNYKIRGGEDADSKRNKRFIKEIGKLHLLSILEQIKAEKSSSFYDLENFIRQDKYRDLNLKNSYLHENKFWPSWLISEHEFVSPFDEIGAINLSKTISKNFCKQLNVDAVLSTEISYELERGFHIPFVRPNWTALCINHSKLYDSTGELIWEYKFKAKSPIKLKADKSLHLLVYWSSSINTNTTIELLKSVIELSSQKMIGALISDLNKS